MKKLKNLALVHEFPKGEIGLKSTNNTDYANVLMYQLTMEDL